MVSLDAFKGIALASTFVIAMLGGLSPLCGSRSQQAVRALPVMNAASAGVFLSAGLMHLLADALENEVLSKRSEELWGEEGGSLIAISLCTGGFLLLVVVEQAVTACAQTNEASKTDNTLLDGKEREDIPPADDEGDDAEETAVSAASLAVALVVGLGLSLHSVMEGLALGAQQDQAATAGIFFAIIAHKGIAAFALGNKTFQSIVVERDSDDGHKQKMQFILFMALFSLMTPAGIAIGWAATIGDTAEESPWPAAFSAVGAGTFLFVATVEVIPAELGHNSVDRGPKTAGLVVCAFLMGSLAKWA
jgi:zinc transporter 1/2/3